MNAGVDLNKDSARTEGGLASVRVVRFDDGHVHIIYDAHVRDAAGRVWYVSQFVKVDAADLVEVHAALGRAIDANLHAEADKSITPKE